MSANYEKKSVFLTIRNRQKRLRHGRRKQARKLWKRRMTDSLTHSLTQRITIHTNYYTYRYCTSSVSKPLKGLGFARFLRMKFHHHVDVQYISTQLHPTNETTSCKRSLIFTERNTNCVDVVLPFSCFVESLFVDPNHKIQSSLVFDALFSKKVESFHVGVVCMHIGTNGPRQVIAGSLCHPSEISNCLYSISTTQQHEEKVAFILIHERR
jgi:hypothetical protein